MERAPGVLYKNNAFLPPVRVTRVSFSDQDYKNLVGFLEEKPKKVWGPPNMRFLGISHSYASPYSPPSSSPKPPCEYSYQVVAPASSALGNHILVLT